MSQFDEFQQGSKASPRRPKCNTLLDVFCNIRDDGALCWGRGLKGKRTHVVAQYIGGG